MNLVSLVEWIDREMEYLGWRGFVRKLGEFWVVREHERAGDSRNGCYGIRVKFCIFCVGSFK